MDEAIRQKILEMQEHHCVMTVTTLRPDGCSTMSYRRDPNRAIRTLPLIAYGCSKGGYRT